MVKIKAAENVTLRTYSCFSYTQRKMPRKEIGIKDFKNIIQPSKCDITMAK